MPELRALPPPLVHEPWKISPLDAMEETFTPGVDYPFPYVNIVDSGKAARKKMWSHRKRSEVKREKSGILERHTSNRMRRKKQAEG
ncbi:MAG: hypothetical protein CMO34_00685 [Verrucomicrobia bacterium]|nr:hypothetical protein [Verrucomicrobiota bacterium]